MARLSAIEQRFRKKLSAVGSRGDVLILGVSGGPDSMALLDLATRWARSTHSIVGVAHLDHGWRPESGEDREFVAQEACARGVPFFSARADLATHSEADARAARFRFFARVAKSFGANATLLAHTADDQAETVLMRLARGAGIRGVGAMRTETTIDVDGTALRILRPLLGTTRRELRRYLDQHLIPTRHDSTNDDPRWRRNRVRNELVPLLEEIAPGATSAIARFADIAADHADLIDTLARSLLDNVGMTSRTNETTFRRRPFCAAAATSQRAALHLLAGDLGAVDITMERIDAARAAIVEGSEDSEIEWPGGLTVRIGDDCVALLRRGEG
ncbi:MAG: tRNA lysidine(34) synthetase TilS [Chloroflexota bacterium]|nr:MAG: tRNA lysidine(34) synthetase TilS [Chloroflexota bacterium]